MCQNRVVHSTVKVNKGKVIQMLLSSKTSVNKVFSGVGFAPIGEHSSLSKRSIGHTVHHIAVFVAYLFYAANVVGVQSVHGIGISLHIQSNRHITDINIIILCVGGEVVFILPATIYFLFLLCVVNAVGGHSPLLVGIIINSITFSCLVYCVGFVKNIVSNVTLVCRDDNLDF